MQRCIQEPAVKAVIFDSPLLFESGLDQRCDAVVFVEADEVTRSERLRQQRGWDPEELRRRERSQTPLDKKRARADYAIINQDPPDRIRPQVADILERIVSKHTSK